MKLAPSDKWRGGLCVTAAGPEWQVLLATSFQLLLVVSGEECYQYTAVTKLDAILDAWRTLKPDCRHIDVTKFPEWGNQESGGLSFPEADASVNARDVIQMVAV